MSGSAFLAALMVALAALLLWFFARSGPADAPETPGAVDDRETLEDAESELDELDAFTSPEDAEDELRDWGPGAPNP